MANLPKDGRSQEIGRLAGRALGNKLPKSWIEKELDGDSDFGIDYFMQLKNSDDYVAFSFYLQLKGTTAPSYTVNKNYISYDFKVSTLKYYYQQEPLVMVAVVDMKGSEDKLWESIIYYFWLDEDWFAENLAKLETQKTIAVKIPTTQLLDQSLDIYDFYSKRIKEKFAVAELKKGFKNNDRPVAESLELLAVAISKKPILLKSIEDGNDAPWLHNPEGTVANELKRCSESMSSNKLKMAQRILNSLEQDKTLCTDNELAEICYQRANLLTLEGKYDLAEQEFKLAYETDKKDRYQLSYYESKFKLGSIPSTKELEEIIDCLNNDSHHKCIVKAKCLTLLEKSDEAIKLLKDNYPNKIIGQMIILTMSGMDDELDNIINENKDLQFDVERDTYHFNSMSARRCFNKATNDSWLKEEVLPIQGKPGYNLSLMKDAYFFARKSWQAAKDLGYPGDITILLDISILIYGFFDAIPELTVYWESMLSDRPNNPELIRPYSRILFNGGKYQRVIELIEKLEVLDPDDCSLQILSNYHLGKSNNTLELTQKHEALLLSGSVHNIPLIFCISSEIAKEQMNAELAKKYEGIVKTFKEGEPLIAVRKFVTSSNADPSNRSQFIEELYDSYLKLNKPIFIAEQLYRYLDAYKVDSAKQVIELGEHLLTDRELTKPEYLHLAQAFMTSCRWKDAEDLAVKNIAKGIATSKWKLIKAASLQHQGKVGVAYVAIKEAMISSVVTKDQQVFYVDLCLSLGLFDNVIEVVKELISNTSIQKEKIRLLQILISVFSNNTDYPEELQLAIDRYGELINKDDCEQEGQYLLYILTSSVHEKNAEKIKSFQDRLAKYTKAFPNSPILKKGFINPDEGAESVIKSMQAIAGITDEQVQLWDKNKRAIRNGTLPVPFSMLGHFLSDTRDIFTTWVYSLHNPDECLEYRIKHAPQLPKEQFLLELKDTKTILLDETSLLVLSELDLLDTFLASLQHYSIVQSVFDNINHSTHQFGGTIYNTTPKKIMTSLQQNLNKLVLLNVDGKDPIAVYKKVLSDENVLFLSEDSYLLQCLKGENYKIISGNIFNVIELLQVKGLLSNVQVHLNVSKVCELGIFEPNMRMDFLSGTFEHYLNVVNGVDYSTTGFKSIFHKLFEVNRKSDFCLELLFKMLNGTRMHPVTLLSLMKGFLIRHPLKELSSLIALWFIFESIQVPLSKSTLIGRNEEQCNLWVNYKELILRENLNALDSDLLVKNVVRELFNFNEQTREKAHKAIKSCFVPMTQEEALFEKIYQEFALNDKLLNLKI